MNYFSCKSSIYARHELFPPLNTLPVTLHYVAELFYAVSRSTSTWVCEAKQDSSGRSKKYQQCILNIDSCRKKTYGDTERSKRATVEVDSEADINSSRKDVTESFAQNPKKVLKSD